MPLIAAVLLVLCFGAVLLAGAPFLPTRRRQIDAALDLLDLRPGQTMLELGCGDGRVLKAAAERGLHAVGYELNPLLVIVAKLLTWRYRRHVRVIWGNYWTAQWPLAEGIFVFLLDSYMQKLDTKIAQYSSKPVKLVSYAFRVPGKKPAAEAHGLFLYTYR